MTRTLVPLAALALFAVTLTLLVAQVRAGRDPALGRPVAAARAPRQITVKRIERRVIITRVIPTEDGPRVQVVGTAPAPPTVVQTASAAPAPAPAPAPLVTRTS